MGLNPARVRLLAAWLVRLRWRSVWRERTYAVSALMLLIFGGLGLLLWQPALALFLWEFLSKIPEGNRRAFLGLALTFGYGAWMLWIGLPWTSAKPLPLLRLPFLRKERILAAVLAEFLDPFRLFEDIAFVLPPLAVIAATGVRSPGEGVLRGLGLFLLWISAVATRQLLRAALRLAALRDPLGIALGGALLAWLAALPVALSALPWSLDARAWQGPQPGLGAFWPPAWAAQAFAPDGGESAAAGLIALAAAALVMVGARLWLEEREDARAAQSGRTPIRHRGFSRVLVLPGLIGSLVVKGLREPLRDPLLKRTLGSYLLVVAMVFGLLLLLLDQAGLGPYRGQALLGLGLFAVWALCQAKANTITFERGGLPRLLALPVSWRRVLIGLDLAQGWWIGTLAAGVLGVAAVVLGVPEGFFRSWAVSVPTTWGCLAIMHMVSSLFPLRIERDAQTIAMPVAPGFFYMFASLGVIGVGIGLLAAMPSPWDVGAVALWNALVYGVSVLLAPRTLGSREWGLWI